MCSTHPYIQDLLPDSVASFGLLLHKERHRAAARRLLHQVPHLDVRRQSRAALKKTHNKNKQINTCDVNVWIWEFYPRNVLTMSSKRSVAGPALLRPALLLGWRGTSWSEGALGGWVGVVVAAGAGVGVRGVALAGGEGKKKSWVCVDTVLVEEEVRRRAWLHEEHVAAVWGLEETSGGVSEICVSGGRSVAGGGEGGREGGGEGFLGRDGEGKKEKWRGEDGERRPASSLSISRSSFTSPGGSIPYLRGEEGV